MSPRRAAARRARSAPPVPPPVAPPAAGRAGDAGALIAWGAIALVLVGSALAVDPLAEAAFDAPKRLVTLVGLAVAAAALGAVPRRDGPAWSWARASREQRVAVVLLACAAAGALCAALASPRRGVSLDALRALGLYALALPLGASRALEGGRARAALGVFLAASAVNAAVFALEVAGGIQIFATAARGGRSGIGGLAGNEGQLAIALALAAVAWIAVALLWARTRAVRLAAGAGALSCAVALALAQNVTAMLALAVGAGIVLAARMPRRALAAMLGAAAVAGAALLLSPPVARRAGETAAAVRAAEWDRLLSYRLGPWAGALDMARARPLVGTGPGTFGAELVPHRLAAEVRLGRRLVNPFLAGSYTEAHCDYLQAAAELGVPATLALLGAGIAVGVGLRRVARGADPAADREAVLLLALLATGATAALTWFPMQRPLTMVVLLLVAGRAWRLAGRPDSATPPVGRAMGAARLAAAGIAAVALFAALAPEEGRYAAERQLYRARAVLEAAVSRGARGPDPALAFAATNAREAAAALPGDWRAPLVEGTALLLAGRAEDAARVFRAALAEGERPEILMSLGRAYAALGRMNVAAAAVLRAAWVSPAVLDPIGADTRQRVLAEVERLERALAAGRQAAPPPAP